MKTNIIANNTVINSIMNNVINRAIMAKKSYIKYLCAVLLVIGTSAHAWGTGIYLEYNSTKYYTGSTITLTLNEVTLPSHGSPSFKVGNDAGWTQDTYYHYGVITSSLSGSGVSFLLGSYTPSAGVAVDPDDNEMSYYTYNASAQYWYATFQLGYYFAAAGTNDITLTVTEKDQADGTTVLQTATFTIRFVVNFTGYTITYNLTGFEHASPYNPTATSGEFHAVFELADNYSTPITGTYSDGFVTNAPITIGTSGDCYYNLGDLYYTEIPKGNITINLTATIDCTPLSAPTNLEILENEGGHGTTVFGWDAVANASSYKIVVTRNGVSASETITETTYEYTFGTGEYTWKVRANGDGTTYCAKNDYTSGPSFCVGADLSAVTPSNLEASSITNTTATISWDAVANAVSYELLIVDEDETTIDAYEGSSTSWDVSGLTAGTTYTIWWQAVNSCDDSYNSNIDKNISFTTTNNHTVSFNANGGTGSMDAVVRTHGTTYDLPACTFMAPSGKVFKCWAEGSAGGTERAVGYTHTVNADITFYAKWRDAVISDYVFSCADLTLTAHPETDGAPIFITSVANKKVRSQGYITITGNGLTPSTALTFPGLNSKFEVLTSTGGTISTDASGAIDVNAYIFYTPGADETTDGILKITGITVAVGGDKPKQKTLTYDIIGRHLPTAGYVIAGKKDNKWWALPSNMASTSTPAPVEIAVNDINNPSLAYTAASNVYGLEGPTTSGSGNNISTGNGQYIRFTMSIEDGHGTGNPAPLFGTSGSEDASNSPKIGKSGTAIATNNLSEGWWWELKQTNTSITNPQDAKYTIKCANNNHTLSIKNSPFVWGLYASGVEELRLIPASDIIYTEAYFVEWGQHGGVVEVDATGIDATSVVAHLGEATSSAITLSQTGTSVKGSATKYNYTINFGEGIDFAAATSNGALLRLEWKNGEAVKAMTSLVVPKIIAESKTMSSIASGDAAWSSAEVHVLPGVTLEADAYGFGSDHAVTIDQLEIYPGATVKVTTGTLDVRKLVLRNGWKRIGGKAYDVARLHIATTANLTKTNNTDKWYSDWYIDFDQYYPIAVPWEVTVANMSYKNTSSAVSVGPGNSNSVRLRYYDGNSRATNVQTGVGDGANWKQYGADGCLAVPTTLEPSHGYAMTARRPTGKAFSIIRMPLTFTNAWGALGEQGSVDETHKDTVKVTAYGVKPESKTVYAEGWNFIANPYMALYQGTITLTPAEGDATTINVVNIPDVDFKEYGQYATATTKLKPSSGFLIQTPATGTITFGTANRKANAPSFRKNEKANMPEQQAYILLSNEDAEDMMGLFVSEKYTAEYDLNGDMEKFLSDGTSLRTYMHYGEMKLAYVALTETLAQEWIPVTIRIPSTGEYTFSMHEASIAGELEGVYLIDYTNNQITNLIEKNYTFEAQAGTINNRFAINAKVGERETPTGVDVVNGGAIDPNVPIKFLYHEKVFILYQGIIYDAVGKKVREINK